jgi:hypothetical protein
MSILSRKRCARTQAGVLAALAGAPSVVGGDPDLGLFPVGGPDLLDLLAVQGIAAGAGRVTDGLAAGAQYFGHRGRPGLEAGFGLDDAGGGADQVRVAKLPGREDRLVLGVAVVVV